MDFIILFVLGMNLLGFILMAIDKRKARRNRWRVQERDLLAIAIFFGSLGVWAGMKTFHHKTKNKQFTIAVPILIILHIFVLGLYYL